MLDKSNQKGGSSATVNKSRRQPRATKMKPGLLAFTPACEPRPDPGAAGLVAFGSPSLGDPGQQNP